MTGLPDSGSELSYFELSAADQVRPDVRTSVMER